MISSAHRLSHFQEYFFSRVQGVIKEVEKETGKNVINLGIGSPDVPPDPSVIDRLASELHVPENHRYPTYSGEGSFRRAIAAYYSRRFGVTLNPDSEVLPLIGSKEGLVHACFAFINEGDDALVPNPGYPVYSAGPFLADGKIQTYTLRRQNHWLPDLDELENMDLSHTKIWWIGYPNNPTGAIASLEQMKRWVNFARTKNILILYDNPYAEIYFGSKRPHSILEIPGAKDCAIEFNSMSKSHNLAGWRVGMVLGKKEYIQAILNVKSNVDTGIFLPIQKAATFALETTTDEWIFQRNTVYKKRRDLACRILKELGFQIHIPEAGLYIWAASPLSGHAVEELSLEMIEKCQVFITPGTAFGKQGEGFFRISLCQPIEVIQEAGKRMEQFFTSLK